MELNTKPLKIFVTICSITLLQPLLTQAQTTVTDEPTESYEDTIENLNATTAPMATNSDHEEGYFSGLCRRMPRIVNFHDDLNNSLISAPVEFDLGDCVGDCPSNSTTYSELKRRLDGEYLPCCAPTAFKPLLVVVSIYNPVTQRFESRLDRLEDASVTSCGCH